MNCPRCGSDDFSEGWCRDCSFDIRDLDSRYMVKLGRMVGDVFIENKTVIYASDLGRCDVVIVDGDVPAVVGAQNGRHPHLFSFRSVSID